MHTFLARVRREPLTGDVALELVQDTDTVEIAEGAEFVTVQLQVDPFEGHPRP